MKFRIISPFKAVQTIAIGKGIREIERLRSLYGEQSWRKRKGFAFIEFPDGTIRYAELHWYEAHGVGRIEVKIKRIIE